MSSCIGVSNDEQCERLFPTVSINPIRQCPGTGHCRKPDDGAHRAAGLVCAFFCIVCVKLDVIIFEIP